MNKKDNDTWEEKVDKLLEHMHFEHIEQLIHIDDIVISPDDLMKCKEYDNDKLIELVEGIKEYGLISPIIVEKTESGYELISGQRRLVASKIAGLTEIPAIVYDKEQADKEFNRVLTKYNINL